MNARPQLERVEARRLHELRRRVLRNNDPSTSVEDPRDVEPTALHLAVLVNDEVVVCGSFYPSPSPEGDETAWQLRYLATDPAWQRQRLASQLMEAARSYLASAGARTLWANGRDTALDFYRHEGWRTIPGSEHLSKETQLPHTVIVTDILCDDPVTLDAVNDGDVAALTALRREMMFSINLQHRDGAWLEHTATYFAEQLRTQRMIGVVARDASGTAVASCLADLRVGPPGPWNPTGKIGYLHTVSTMPPFRHRGLARTLTTNLLDRLRELEIPVVDLHATPQGRPLYEALGFTLREPQNEMRLRLQEPEAF